MYASRKRRHGRIKMALGQASRQMVLGLLLLLSWQVSAQNGGSGRLVGKVVEAGSGEPVIGASIMLEGTKLGVAANLNGDYVINDVPAGAYRVIVTAVARAKTIIDSVVIRANAPTHVDISLASAEIVGEQVIVEARRLADTEASMLKQREKSASVSDAISAQSISRTGAGDAAAAMTRVTGASVVGGKYVLIRGLGGRYTNTMLNGAVLPTADQDKQSVQLDIVPSSLLDNIVVQKTATPDRSGDFSGGSVNLSTKSIPDAMTLTFSTSSSYNSEGTFKKDMITFAGGSKEWLGADASSHARPSIFSEPGFALPVPASIPAGDSAKAYMIDAATKALDNKFDFIKKRAPLNQSYALTLGNRYSVWERPLGVVLSLTYSRSTSYYDDGVRNRWRGGGTHMSFEYSLTDVKATESVLVGGLASLSYEFHPNFKATLRYNKNQNGQKLSRLMYGAFPRDFTEESTWQTRVLQYTQRSMDAVQVDGEQLLKWFKPIRIDWRGSYARNTQEDPDRRFFSSAFTIYDNDTSYLAGEGSSFGGFPSHYWRDLSESSKEVGADIAVPLGRSSEASKLKLGGRYRVKDRTQNEYMYAMSSQATDVLPGYNGDPNAYYADSLLGVIGVNSRNQRYIFGRVVQHIPIFGNYTGDEKIGAVYGMVQFSPLRKTDVITGVRFETTRMNVILKEKSKKQGRLSSDDWLPSVNLIYHLKQNVNCRGAFGITLARPTMREMAPFGSFEFYNDYIFSGNPNLHRTMIYNYDLRWEWFTRSGEVLAISMFYKKFDDPIERYLSDFNDNATWNNVPDAQVYGVEIEIRQSLDRVPHLGGFTLSSNLTLADSRVALTEAEYKTAKFFNPDASRYRDFGGQSAYVINCDLAYGNQRTGTSASLVYNVFGKRLTENVEGQSPAIYEEPFNSLDLIASQSLGLGLKMKLSAKNLLNDTHRKTQTLAGKVYVAEEYKVGQTYSLGISYEL